MRAFLCSRHHHLSHLVYFFWSSECGEEYKIRPCTEHTTTSSERCPYSSVYYPKSGDYQMQITAFRCTLQIANATWFAICCLSLVVGIIASGNEQIANQIGVHKSSIVDQNFVPDGFSNPSPRTMRRRLSYLHCQCLLSHFEPLCSTLAPSKVS